MAYTILDFAEDVLSQSDKPLTFFQAVSNSSWANEGYWVASQITQDDDLFVELERFNLADCDSSSVLFPAKIRSDSVNRIPIFCASLKMSKLIFNRQRFTSLNYDPVIDDSRVYIQKTLFKGKK